uniref:Crystallin zeta like 1 n=1 Tax=Naja naja TaxID=35670 RepID=A0A8C6VPQ9_NAJNA
MKHCFKSGGNPVFIGILPLDSEESGLCEEILVHEHYLVHKPEQISWMESAGAIHDGLSFGTIAIQLAQHRGAKVISTVYNLEEKQCLERIVPSVVRIIDVSNGKYDLTETCLEETGGLGVNIIIDAGVRLHNKENETTSQQLLPHKHDIITLLSAGGHWVTTEKNLQLDPPDCRYLFLKGASVSFLNDEIWNLSNVMEKLSSGVFKPHLDKPVPLYEAKVSMELVQKNQARKKQVVQL